MEFLFLKNKIKDPFIQVKLFSGNYFLIFQDLDEGKPINLRATFFMDRKQQVYISLLARKKSLFLNRKTNEN